MDCKNYQDMISDYIDGLLSDDEIKDFETHISKCENCKEEYEITKEIVDSCDDLEEIELPYDFNKKLHEKLVLVNEDKKIKKLPWYKDWKVYSGIAAIFIFAFLLKVQISNYIGSKSTDIAYVKDANLENSNNTNNIKKRRN